MMKKIGWIIVAICLWLPAYASKKEPPGKSVIKYPGEVSQLVNYTSLDIEYIVGAPKIVLEGTPDQLKDIDIDITGKRITVKYNGKESRSFSNMSLKVYGDNINNFILYGSGNFRAGDLAATKLNIKNYGSGDIIIRNIDSTKLQLDHYGSGDVDLQKAACSSLIAILSGSGSIKMKDVHASSAEIIEQGSGSFEIDHIEAASLKAINNGSGSIKIGGNAATTVVINNGTGSLDSRRLISSRVTNISNSSN